MYSYWFTCKIDWGLGPSLQNEKDSLIFGHGGKNAGFTNDMKAYVYQGNAVIVMTNADNGGKLISEIKNAVSNYYNWGISQPKIIEVLKLSDTELKKYTGTYESKQPKMMNKVILKENQLIITNSPLGALKLVPIATNKFIDKENGIVFKFLIDEKVTGFMVNNSFKMVKAE